MGFPFSDHVELLEHFLKGRPAIVNKLDEQLFGARGKAYAHDGDRESIAEVFGTAFFESPPISRDLSRLHGQLERAHLADGFEPAGPDGYARTLDPVELFLRACHYWNAGRWPGRNGRLVYADSLYAAFVLRQLEYLSVRLWDEGNDELTERLKDLQRLLDRLNAGPLRPVRDARWLIQTAQGPLTRHVSPYFVKADNIARSFSGSDRIEIHKAGAVLAGGHLRSQLRHLSFRTGWAFDDPQLLALTRSSNSMDMALLVRDLVPLLDEYHAACERQDTAMRMALADAILQGMSADPELLLTRLDLLAPSTIIEELFIERGDTGAIRHTAWGTAHNDCLARYSDLVGRAASSLLQDCPAFDPAGAAYSPLGIVYGFCADLFSNMVLATLRSPSPPDLGLEDAFVSRERLEDKRAQAEEWERLPKSERERAPFEHSSEWARQMYARLTESLAARAERPIDSNASSVRTSRLYIVPRGVAHHSVPVAQGFSPAVTSPVAQGFSPAVPAQAHCLTSDASRARATGATLLTADRIAADRAEGRLLASAQADGGWFGVSKVPLTLYTSQGKDAWLADVPHGVIDLLRVVCPEFLVILPTE